MRRRYTAPIDEHRCRYDINLRMDKSPARCMRKAVINGMCKQHAEIVAAWSCDYCGGNDETPPNHCADCERPTED